MRQDFLSLWYVGWSHDLWVALVQVDLETLLAWHFLRRVPIYVLEAAKRGDHLQHLLDQDVRLRHRTQL